MNVPTNVSNRTDFIFHRHEGAIEEHADHWVVRTPKNPTFWFGNFVLFQRAPRPGDLARWLEVHENAFGDSLNHQVFGWDEPREGDISEFLSAGFSPSHGIALSLQSPPRDTVINPELTVRPISTDAEWQQVLEQQIRVDRIDFKYPEDGGVFRRNQLKEDRQLAAEARGHWWGAFRGDQLAGNMGLFFDEQNQIGRFQNVATDPDFRRQRVCTTLLHHIVAHAFTEVGAEKLVICTSSEDENPAIPTYQSFGFQFEAPNYAVKRIN